MQNDYISREAAISLLHYNPDEACSAVVADFEALPAADVRPVVYAEDEPIEQEKPLKDWTLGEVKEYCRRDGNRCFGCPFLSAAIGCISNRTPCSWDLTGPPRFTQKEIERAKAIKQFAPGVEALMAGTSVVWGIKNRRAIIRVERDLFPSIQPGQTVKISEIIGEEAGKD